MYNQQNTINNDIHPLNLGKIILLTYSRKPEVFL
jgi:hypothetical protein